MSSAPLRKRKLALGQTPPSSRTDGKTHLMTWRLAGGVMGYRGYHPICRENATYYITHTTYDVKLADAFAAVDCKVCLAKMRSEDDVR